MKLTIDINPEHGIALVQTIDPAGNTTDTRYIALDEAPPLEAGLLNLTPTYTRQVYLKQHHYVASHAMVGLQVADRITSTGDKPPKYGWQRWKP